MDPIHVEEPVVDPAPPVQTPEKDAIVASVTDDALVMAHEAQAATPTPEEIVTIAQGAQDGGMLGVVLALVAVLGGGAAWKHYAKTAEQKHEREMRELELRSQAPTVQPPPCQAADAATQARLRAIEARLGKAEEKALSFSGGSSDLEERVEAIERANKKRAAK
jgi:hypothetical protein